MSGSTTSRAPYRRDEKTDSDGWGADAPPVSRSQLEKVAPAYRPTKVDISAIRAQPTSTTSGFGGTSSAGDRPDVVRGAYQPIGKVDIAAIRAQAQQKSDRPDIVKGAYEPVGKVDIAAIRAQARPRSPIQQRDEDEGGRPKPLSERSAAFSQSERLTSLPKPKPAKKFGTGASGFGTKPPTPGGFGLGPSVPAASPVGAASRDFGSSGGKTPAQLWAEKKARERGLSGASETTPPTLSPGYTGQHYAPVSTSHTGRSSGSNDGQSTKFSQQRSDDHEEDVQAPAGGISALRNMFSGAPPMGAPTSPKSPPRASGYQFQQTTGDRAPPLDTSSRPTIIAGGAVAIPGFSPRHTEDTGELTTAGIPPPPVQPPRSPTPPTPELTGSPIRIAMPVGRGDPVRRHDPEPESSIPIESLSRVVPHEDDLEDELVPSVGGAVGRQALVLFDYEATEENEIDLIEGQVVGEVDMVDDVRFSHLTLIHSKYIYTVPQADRTRIGGRVAMLLEIMVFSLAITSNSLRRPVKRNMTRLVLLKLPGQWLNHPYQRKNPKVRVDPQQLHNTTMKLQKKTNLLSLRKRSSNILNSRMTIGGWAPMGANAVSSYVTLKPQIS